jgi:polyhydroxybutyrate depolymerase
MRIGTRDGPRTAVLLRAERTPAPAVVVLHGAISTAAWAAGRFGFAEAAAARGFSAVFPQSVGAQWNAERGPLSAKADDVAFLRGLIVALVERGIADPGQVYIAGVSSGGMMALRMVCDASELLAGAGTIIASMPVAAGAACRPARPVPVVMFNGTADGLVPYHGGRVGPLGLGGIVWGAERTAAFLAYANGCGFGPLRRDISTERTSVTRIAWTACARNAGVILYRINGGRHQVLGRRRVASLLFGGRYRYEDDVSAAETIMTVFAGDLRT